MNAYIEEITSAVFVVRLGLTTFFLEFVRLGISATSAVNE